MDQYNLLKSGIAGSIVILSFPFVYIGGTTANYIFITIGMLMLIGGVIAMPAITYFTKCNSKEGREND